MGGGDMIYRILIIVGITLMGYMAPELIAAFTKTRVSLGINLMNALAWCLIAIGILFGFSL
jgi:hypothetical protein